MKSYLDSLQYVLDNGTERDDRTGTGTIGVFGLQTRYNLRETFPAMTTKRLMWKAVVSELLWFLEGSGDERRLADLLHNTRDPSKRTIWTDNADAPYWVEKAKFPGDLGRVYGVQWRSWRYFKPLGHKEDDLLVGKYEYVDQIKNLVDGIQKDPYGRRHILTAWNPAELEDMALPPCHMTAQFYVANGELSCQMYQRSADMFLGVPFNIASYSLLTHMVAQVCGLKAAEFIHTIGDAHIYLNHIDAVKEQLKRDPLPLPTLKLTPIIRSLEGFTMSDIELVNYQCHDAIKAKMAV